MTLLSRSLPPPRPSRRPLVSPTRASAGHEHHHGHGATHTRPPRCSAFRSPRLAPGCCARASSRRRTGGGIDLGVLATAAFFSVGAAEVVATRKLAAPPWFNLAWWGLQTFISAESEGEANGGGEPSPAE